MFVRKLVYERRQYRSIVRGEQIKTNELENDDTGPG